MKLIPLHRERINKPLIRIAQYNILAGNLATKSHFPYVMDQFLNWDKRKWRLISQLEALQADVICLQELSDYWTFFRGELLKRGYESVYTQRPSLHTSNWSGEKKQDGCGVFYRQDNYVLKEFESVNYHDSHDRIAVLAVLQCRTTHRFILVANTHLWWNSKKIDHQLAQLYELENEIMKMSNNVKLKYAKELEVANNSLLPVFLCGDFNNSPSSPIYEYLQDSFFKKYPNMQNEFEMRSAYGNYQNFLHVKNGDESSMIDACEPGKEFEPPHTTVNYRRCWTIDYIWYSSKLSRCDRLLELPEEEELRSEEGPEGWLSVALSDDSGGSGLGRLPRGLHGNHNGIPNSQHPSDHIPLMAEFSFL